MMIKSKKQLYVSLLRGIYSGETQMILALPKMAKASISPPLQRAFANHYHETREQSQRLEQAFNMLSEDIGNETCEAMQGLIAESEEIIDRTTDDNTRDAALIAIAQKIKHYEIASYGTLCRLAKELGFKDQAALLYLTLQEEKEADIKLTDIAERASNRLAVAA